MLNGRTILLLVVTVILSTAVAYASQCVKCHTDVEKLKAIAKTIVKPVGSTETAGKG